MSLISHSGVELPPLGFGTYQLRGDAGAEVVARAIDAGYALIDAAFNYDNEGAVGAAVRRAGRSRDEVIVTSKLPGRYQAYDLAVAAIEESVLRTGLDHLDLYLIHWPNPSQGLYVEAWQALIDARERGLLRAIGVSNFLPEHLERLQQETGVLPDVNQIELHPFFPQVEQVAFHAEHGILTEAWSPLGRKTDLLGRPELARVADAHGVTPGQVVLAWGVARGVIPIPKAASDRRQAENLAALDVRLSDEEIAAITAMGSPQGRVADQDPATHEEF